MGEHIMKQMTFIEFILNEDINDEITQLRNQINVLDIKKTRSDDLFNKQKMRLQQIIATKQKQASQQKQNMSVNAAA